MLALVLQSRDPDALFEIQSITTSVALTIEMEHLVAFDSVLKVSCFIMVDPCLVDKDDVRIGLACGDPQCQRVKISRKSTYIGGLEQ